MLKIFSILVLLFGSLQPSHEFDQTRNTENAIENSEHSKILAREIRPPPCFRRNLQSNPIDNPNEWLPTYISRIIKPSINTNNINPEALKYDNIIINKIDNLPEETFLAPKKNQQNVGVFIEPAINSKLSRNLLSDQNGLEGHDDVQEPRSKVKNQSDTLSSTGHLEGGVPVEENILHKANSTLQPNEDRGIEKSHASLERTQDRPVIVDSDYLYPPNIDQSGLVRTKPEKHSLKTSTTTNILKDEQPDDDVNDCVANERHSKGLEIESEPRRFLSERNDYSLKDNLENNDAGVLKRNEDQQEPMLTDPAKGVGIREMSISRMSLLKHSRVCYACSTINNPTCWNPDRRTTVKYCRQGHEVCVTKTFQNTQNELILTRDCGVSCDDTDIPGPKYKSCSVCHTDMCNDSPNGASSLNKKQLILSVFVIFVVKCTF